MSLHREFNFSGRIRNNFGVDSPISAHDDLNRYGRNRQYHIQIGLPFYGNFLGIDCVIAKKRQFVFLLPLANSWLQPAFSVFVVLENAFGPRVTLQEIRAYHGSTSNQLRRYCFNLQETSRLLNGMHTSASPSLISQVSGFLRGALEPEMSAGDVDMLHPSSQLNACPNSARCQNWSNQDPPK